VRVTLKLDMCSYVFQDSYKTRFEEETLDKEATAPVEVLILNKLLQVIVKDGLRVVDESLLRREEDAWNMPGKLLDQVQHWIHCYDTWSELTPEKLDLPENVVPADFDQNPNYHVS
jgi:hypothetical protein